MLCLHHSLSLNADPGWQNLFPKHLSISLICHITLQHLQIIDDNLSGYIRITKPHGALECPRAQAQPGWRGQGIVITFHITIAPKCSSNLNITTRACNDSDLETSWTCSNESAITKDIFDSLELWTLTWNANKMSCQRYHNFTYPKSMCCSL